MRAKDVLVLSTLCVVLLSNICQCLDTAAAANPTCSLKDDCNLSEQLLNVGGGDEQHNKNSGDKLESKIASIFEDSLNYSLQMFADETVLEYASNMVEHNITRNGNFTLSHVSAEEDDDIEETERGKLQY